MKPTKIDWARLAAYLDGEGGIYIGWFEARSGEHDEVYTSDRMYLSVANTDPRLILWCKERFGGTIQMEKSPPRKRRRMFFWIIQARKAATILQNCLPYFLLKKEQALLAIAWQATKSRAHARKGVPPKVSVRRRRLEAQLRFLKHTEHAIPRQFVN